MAPKTLYITIDDFPTSHGLEKIQFLTQHQIPAVIYARGECLKKHLDFAVEAIKMGYLLGNHSYSHPYFSQLSVQECRREIDETEILINQAYAQAGQKRPLKTIRYPFGDPAPQEIEIYLHEQNFKKAVLPSYLDHSSVSVPWTLDTLDYKPSLTRDSSLLVETLKKSYNPSSEREEVVLLHDFDHNQRAFKAIIQYFQEQHVIFKELMFHA